MAASSPSNVMQKLKKENVYIYETNTNYQDSALSISGACVGSLTYQLLIILQAQTIYLLGLDLAVDQKTGKDHAQTHQDLQQLTLKNDLAENDTLHYKTNLLEIKGNFQKNVLTTPHFYSSVDTINRYFSKLIKPYQKIYNLNDGAFFKGTIPLKATDIETKPQHITQITPLLKKILNQNSKISLTKENISNLRQKLKHAQKLKQKLNEHKLSDKTQDAETYAKDIYTILVQDEALGFYELTRVLDSYLNLSLHFVYYYLNNSSINFKNYQKIDKLFKSELLSIIDFYIYKISISLEEL